LVVSAGRFPSSDSDFTLIPSEPIRDFISARYFFDAVNSGKNELDNFGYRAVLRGENSKFTLSRKEVSMKLL